MKIACFDCASGISGDMTVGAFIDAGLSIATLRKRLRLLGIGGYRIAASRTSRSGITGTKFDVLIARRHAHDHTTFAGIRKCIDGSRLPRPVKDLALDIFTNLARAEGRIHGVIPEKVTFHEVGAIDSIIDIVASAIAVIELGIERSYCLNLSLGMGNVRSQHGRLPLPAPAVLELLKDKPLRFTDLEYELVTPTGAAILTTLVRDFRDRPRGAFSAVGYGAGSVDIPGSANMLRVLIGESSSAALDHDEVIVLETNIDDMNPVAYEYILEKLFNAGALDAYLTPVYMKKTRPGILLTVIAPETLAGVCAQAIMRETTSSGVRYYRVARDKMRRSFRNIVTKYGTVKVKVNTGPEGVVTVSPEYEDCKALALKAGVPFRKLFDEVKKKIC
ncbi:MAG: nickel pincer cofactor biosynthesis protein LarC [Candidatus Omnitrophota bacterium]